MGRQPLLIASGTLGEQMTQLLNAVIREMSLPGRLSPPSAATTAKTEDELNEELKQYWMSCLCPGHFALYSDFHAK